MRIVKLITSALAVLALVGCAHPMSMAPELAKLEPAQGALIKKKVVYVLADEARNRMVTTPGGGGDSVTYYPYKDIETGFYKMLSNVFDNVGKASSMSDTAALAGASYIIVPTVVTSSSGSNPLIWLPTDFNVDMTLAFTDAKGAPVTTKKVVGAGKRDDGATLGDHSYSGRKASEDALKQMQRKLHDSPELR